MRSEETFWSIDDKGSLSIQILDMYQFLDKRGFRKRTINDEVELYRQNGYVIEQCFTPTTINEITNYLTHEFKDGASRTIDFPRKGPLLFEYDNKSILEKIVKYGWGRLFAENNYNLLSELNVDIKRHTRDRAFFYFKNGFVQVTAKGCTFHGYDEFRGKYIYKDYLVNRDIRIVDIMHTAEQHVAPLGSCFIDFLSRAAGCSFTQDVTLNLQMVASMLAGNNNHKDNNGFISGEKLTYLLKLIGFLLHDYKQQGLTDFCVILCDDNTGGSGKGVMIQAMKQLTSVCIKDCRKTVGDYDPEDLTERTRIKVYNDVNPSFNFGETYNEITDGGTIRHMYGSPRPVAYKDTWKTLLTSNYVIRGNSGPDNRRQKVFSMNSFFDQGNTIQSFYKHSFFSEDWTQADWNFFYNIMFKSVQLWLASNYKIDYVDREYNERKLEVAYPMEFREYVDSIQRGVYHKTGDLYWKFKDDDKYRLSPFVRKLTPHFFSSMLKSYLDEMKVSWKKSTNRSEIWIGK